MKITRRTKTEANEKWDEMMEDVKRKTGAKKLPTSEDVKKVRENDK